MVVKWEHIAILVVIWYLWSVIQKSRGHDRAPVIGGGPVSQPDKFDSIFGIGNKKRAISGLESKVDNLGQKVRLIEQGSDRQREWLGRIEKWALTQGYKK